MLKQQSVLNALIDPPTAC